MKKHSDDDAPPRTLADHELAGILPRAPREIEAVDIRTWRQTWPGDDYRITKGALALRDLRFARVGEVLSHGSTGEWTRLVAALLNGDLAADLAPCTRRGTSRGANGLDVRGLFRVEIDWSAVEPREWVQLERAGLRRAVALRFQAGEIDDAPAKAPRPEIEAARALLTHIPAGTATERAAAASELVREALFGDALAAANGNRASAADLLGIPATRVSEAVRAHPALAAQWPAGPRGRKPTGEEP